MERAKESNAKALHAKVGEGNLRRFSICSFLYFMLWKGICACLQFSHKQLLQLEKTFCCPYWVNCCRLLAVTAIAGCLLCELHCAGPRLVSARVRGRGASASVPPGARRPATGAAALEPSPDRVMEGLPFPPPAQFKYLNTAHQSVCGYISNILRIILAMLSSNRRSWG